MEEGMQLTHEQTNIAFGKDPSRRQPVADVELPDAEPPARLELRDASELEVVMGHALEVLDNVDANAPEDPIRPGPSLSIRARTQHGTASSPGKVDLRAPRLQSPRKKRKSESPETGRKKRESPEKGSASPTKLLRSNSPEKGVQVGPAPVHQCQEDVESAPEEEDDVAPTFKYLVLRDPSKDVFVSCQDHLPVPEMEPEWQDSLRAWWQHLQAYYPSAFQQWWPGNGIETSCLGEKAITKGNGSN